MEFKKPSLKGMAHTEYLGHFAQDKYIQMGHNDVADDPDSPEDQQINAAGGMKDPYSDSYDGKSPHDKNFDFSDPGFKDSIRRTAEYLQRGGHMDAETDADEAIMADTVLKQHSLYQRGDALKARSFAASIQQKYLTGPSNAALSDAVSGNVQEAMSSMRDLHEEYKKSELDKENYGREPGEIFKTPAPKPTRSSRGTINIKGEK